MTNLAWLYSLGVPLSFVLIGILANRLGRKDNDPSPRKNLWAVSTSVLLMSLGTAVSDLQKAAKLDSYILFWMFIFLVLIFISIDFDRYASWARDEEGLPTEQKDIYRGIVGPNAISVFSFFLYRINS